MSVPVENIVANLREAKKYRHLADQTLERVARWALERHPSGRDATKAAKRKLHQVFAAYGQPNDLDTLLGRVVSLPGSADKDALRAGCLDLLRGHASTAERLPYLEQLYPALWSVTGVPNSVLDLACGYNPFTVPWMGLASGAQYRACDIDHRLTAAVNMFLQNQGRLPLAETRDILSDVPDGEADVGLLFKTLPCLEQQMQGSGRDLLSGLRCRHIVVSYPLESLGGRDKGMRRTYTDQMQKLAATLELPVHAVEFPSELYFILSKAGS